MGHSIFVRSPQMRGHTEHPLEAFSKMAIPEDFGENAFPSHLKK